MEERSIAVEQLPAAEVIAVQLVVEVAVRSIRVAITLLATVTHSISATITTHSVARQAAVVEVTLVVDSHLAAAMAVVRVDASLV